MNETNHPTNGAEKPAPLDVSVKITPSKEDGNLLAFGTCAPAVRHPPAQRVDGVGQRRGGVRRDP